MLAFGEPGEIREVEIDSPEVGEELDVTLERIFHNGQNDFQPQQHPSVSVGDVVHYGGRTFLVAGMGFEEISLEKLKEWRNIPRRERSLRTITM